MALIQDAGQRQVVVAVSPEAPPEVVPGMTWSEARARCAALHGVPATPAADRRALEALGYWLMRFSPSVCVQPPAALFLDATGLSRLFGGPEALRRRVEAALASLRIGASVTIAPTPGAAWALAAFGPAAGPRVVQAGPPALADALAPLTVEALRLEDATVAHLAALGVRTIGALRQLPRADLAVRFGPMLLARIDQALGALHEPLAYLLPRTPIRATLEFEAAVESLDAIHLAVRALAREIAGPLAQRGLGARELRLTFGQPYAGAIEKTLRLTRPCRNESALLRLLGCAIEHLDAPEGIVSASLFVPLAERLGDEQVSLLGADEHRAALELDGLVERLRARLDRAVEWGELAESNLPEHAGRFADRAGPAIATMPSAAAAAGPRAAIDRFRPLRLLGTPRPIDVIVTPSERRDGRPVSFTRGGEVHRLDHVRGPERITGQWWNGRWKTRDYFDVLDAAGRRYWIFRAMLTRPPTPPRRAPAVRWFLHGIFE